MKSFKNYQTTRSPQPSEISQDPATAEELTQKIAAAYHGKSSAEMLGNILTEAEKSKRAGTLSNEEIDAFFTAFSPMLDNYQRKKLQAVVNRLKEL